MELDTFKNTLIPLRGKLMHYSQKLLGNEDDAEDVVQETYLKLWSIRDRLHKYKCVEALAMQITKNLSIDKLRIGKMNADEKEIIALHTTIKTPFEQLDQSDAVNHIRMLIEKLPKLQQMIIRMKDVDGYELDEIAAITGTQLQAVRVNLSRARKKVREQFLAIYK